ncbi:MAG: porin family protein [Thiovulaceae bacterium]|nr:porin family protein [Sulfurimonadaceae bacterium]
MKRLLVAGLIAAMPMALMAEGGTTGNVNLLIGQKTLDKDDWERFDKQAEIGVMFDIGGKDWPVNFALDMLVSGDEETISGVDVDASTAEMDIGIRKSFLDGNLHPYVGGGLALIQANIEGTQSGVTVSDDDTGVGVWVSGGLYYSIIEHINVGLDLRYSHAKTTLFGVDKQAGGTHVALFAGYHW